MNAKRKAAQKGFRDASWRDGRNVATLRLQMADAERGDRIRELREKRLMSQEAFASAVGVSHRTIQLWEGGGNMSWPNLERLAEFAEVSTDYIAGGREEKPSSTPDLLGVNGNEPEWVARLEEKLDEIRDILAVEEMERAVTDAAQEPTETPATAPRRPAASDR